MFEVIYNLKANHNAFARLFHDSFKRIYKFGELIQRAVFTEFLTLRMLAISRERRKTDRLVFQQHKSICIS